MGRKIRDRLLYNNNVLVLGKSHQILNFILKKKLNSVTYELNALIIKK